MSQSKITLDEVRAFRAEMFRTSMELVETKGADYNRDQQESGDTLFNLKVAELLGAVDTAEQGILVRLSDKLMRLISLTKTAGREAQVKDESVLDTIRDVHNYVDYLGLIWLKRNRPELFEDVQIEFSWDGEAHKPSVISAGESVVSGGETGAFACGGCTGEKAAHTYGEECERHVPRGE